MPGTPGLAVVTTALAGDLRPGSPGASARRRRVLAGAWSWTRQVHGADVAVLTAAAATARSSRRMPADGLVAPAGSEAPPRLAMFSADCALVALASPEGVLGIAHCGWRGLLGGVLQEVAGEMRRLGASELVAVRGPCIGPECYEFGRDELDEVARRYGAAVRSETTTGKPALDLVAGVEAAAAEAGVAQLRGVGSCTACGRPWFSHRARGETARQAVVVTLAAA